MKWTAIATLDIIGRVGFNHDFKGGKTQEAKDIQKAWTDQVNAGMETATFYAQIFLQTFPFLLYIPIDAIQKQGDIKMVINCLAEMFLKMGADVEKGWNLLSLMVKVNSQGDGKMSNQQMIDHITMFM
uniref:Putative cytochrome P450 n=1 Tax=Moniliophthora roreri TaxID=221103 RepID=A0A0W0FI52_MONRR